MNLLTNLFFRNELKISFFNRKAPPPQKHKTKPKKPLNHPIDLSVDPSVSLEMVRKECCTSEGTKTSWGACFRNECLSAGEHPATTEVQVLTSCVLGLN